MDPELHGGRDNSRKATSSFENLLFKFKKEMILIYRVVDPDPH
jgi:hypothetical protein